MKYDISLFSKHINKHPWGIFDKFEIEQFMAWFLHQCVKANNLDHVVKTRNNEDYLCPMGILEKVDEQQYRLTEQSKEKLYTVYKRKFLEPEDFRI